MTTPVAPAVHMWNDATTGTQCGDMNAMNIVPDWSRVTCQECLLAAPSPAQPAAAQLHPYSIAEAVKVLEGPAATAYDHLHSEDTKWMTCKVCADRLAAQLKHTVANLCGKIAKLSYESFAAPAEETTAQPAKIDDVIYNHLSSYQGNCDCKYHLAVKNNPQPAIASTEEK